MRCPKCQSDNRDGIKFCEECGAKFEMVCNACRAKIPLGKKFCGECGTKLDAPVKPQPKDLSLDEKIDKIQRYLPKGLKEKILSQKDKIEGERKQLTVMFCDMVGFTAFVEELGPEESYNFMDEVYEVLIHKVREYGGTVNEMTGDGVLALFGAPIALEDAPQRSIRSALSIHREMAIFSDRIKKTRPELRPVKMRIGIHTGPVVVGTLGNDLRVEFKAVGDTVNLASRLSDLSNPGTTFVTENTFNLTKGFFRFEALGENPIKGKKTTVKIYQVLAASSRRTRFDVSAEIGLTPLVSRERELKLMLDGLERVKEGRGKAFSIMSDAGVGKSRLLYEFRKAVSGDYVTFLEGKCLSYSSKVPFHPIADLLKSNFNIGDEDDDSETIKKVKKGLKILGADEPSTLPYILELLSVEEDEIVKPALSPEAKKERIVETIKILMIKGAEIRPLIVAFEDLHWMDESSVEVLKTLLDSIPGSKVMMVFTFRPTFVCSWTGKSFHSQLTLNRLSEKESRIMLSHLIGAATVESSFAERVLEKTEGVPFFIEEFIKSFRDMKILEKKGDTYSLVNNVEKETIPSTIHDVIMSRIDSLPETAKDLIQVGSVIEREFAYALIAKVMELPETDLLSNLSILKDTEMLYERGIFPESRFIFKHALTREVIYDSILNSRKKNIHEKVGNAIEALYHAKIDEHYGVLAEHFTESENYARAAKYSMLAAAGAEFVGSMNDAIRYAENAVECFEKPNDSDKNIEKIIDARIALGMYLLRMLFYKEAKDAIFPIAEKAVQIGYKSIFPKLFTILGTYEFNVKEDVVQSFKYLEDAVEIAEEFDDKASLFIASFRLALAYSLDCRFEEGAASFKKAFAIAKASNNLLGMSAVKSYLSVFCYIFWGRLQLAEESALDAIRISEESGDIYTKAMAYTVYGWALAEKGVLDEGRKYLSIGVELCEKINYDIFNAVARTMLGRVLYEIENWEKSKEHYSKAAAYVEHCGGFRSWSEYSRLGAIMAETKIKASKKTAEKLIRYKGMTGIQALKGWKSRYVGAIFLNIGDRHIDEAEEWIKKAIVADGKNDMRMHLGADYRLLAELYKRKGDKLLAREALVKAIEIYKGCEADARAQQAEKMLSHI